MTNVYDMTQTIQWPRATATTDRRPARPWTDGALMAHFQPIIRIDGMAVSALEVPGRMERGGLSSLHDFLPDAVEADLLGALTDEVVHITLRDMHEHDVAIPVAVNVPAQVVNDRLAERLDDALRAWGLPNDRLAIEVTADALDDTDGSARQTLAALRAGGHPILLDDVGAGRSAATALCDLPVDAVKIDAHLVTAITTDAVAGAVVADLVATAHTLGIEVIAQGVEDAATYDWLVDHDVDAMQGSYICPPRPLDASYANWPLLHRLSQ